MLESLAIWVGRNLKIPGSGRVLSLLFPGTQKAKRFLSGVRSRSDGLLMQLDSRNLIDRDLLFRGEYEPQLTLLLSRLTPVGGVTVDVGANIGCHTLTLAQAVGSKGLVFAFEPNPPIRAVLERNVALNKFENVHIFNCALGDEPGTLPLRVPQANSAEHSNMGLASLVALETPHDLINVPVQTLDAALGDLELDRVDVVKIDVQGYECQVLRGMANILERHRPAVIFEYELWAWNMAGSCLSDVMTLLNAKDYSLWQFADKTMTSIMPVHDEQSLLAHADLVALTNHDPRVEMLSNP